MDLIWAIQASENPESLRGHGIQGSPYIQTTCPEPTEPCGPSDGHADSQTWQGPYQRFSPHDSTVQAATAGWRVETEMAAHGRKVAEADLSQPGMNTAVT
jgi:hypothetical protein